MSVQSEINRVKNNVAAAYAAAAEKGAGTPAVANSENLASTIRAIKTNPTLQNKTVTPGTSDQSVQADGGYDGLGTVTVQGDANLVPENIPEGVSIFGVPGNRPAGSEVALGDVTTSGGTSVTISPGFVVKTLLMVFLDQALNGQSRIEYSNGRAYAYYYNYSQNRVVTGGASVNQNNGTLKITVPSAALVTGTYRWMAAS